MNEREQRAEFLMKWFLDVYDGRKAPYPKNCFSGIADLMREFIEQGKEVTKHHCSDGSIISP